MLATDVLLTLEAEADVGGLVVWSGVAVARDEWAEKLAARKRREGARQLRVLQSHGTEDPILPYGLGEGLHTWFEKDAGASTEFISFRGGHTIGGDALRKFLAFLRTTTSKL
jgi:phospholipase/carboxylesterase